MAQDTFRSVEIKRTSVGHYVAHNVRGGSMPIGSGGDEDFTPVELLLAAIGGCTAIDADVVTSRRAEPTGFSVTVSGNKVRDEETGNRMDNLAVSFTVSFPDDKRGDAARALLIRTARLSHDRLCTVSRTVELGTPVTASVNGRPVSGREAG
jgi:putative redox protein